VPPLSDMPSLSESGHGEFGRYRVVPRPLDKHRWNQSDQTFHLALVISQTSEAISVGVLFAGVPNGISSWILCSQR